MSSIRAEVENIAEASQFSQMNPASPDALSSMRQCLSTPISHLKDAVRYLDAAVSAHLQHKPAIAEELFRLADMPEIRQWGKSIWGNSAVHIRFRSSEPILAKELREKPRMPSAEMKAQIHQRDGYHCRFCGMPVIRMETRKFIHHAYPQAVPWGRTEVEQHAAFLAMWAQYDHIVPHARGGKSDLDNLVLTCGTCNFGRAQYTLQEVAVTDPRNRLPIQSQWDGLERFR